MPTFSRVDASIVFAESVSTLTIPNIVVAAGEDLQVAFRHSVNENASTVKWNTTEDLTQIARNGNSSFWQSRWGIQNPTATTASLVITMPSSQSVLWGITFGYTGTKASAYQSGSAAGTGLSGSPTITITSPAGELAIVTYADNGGGGSPTLSPGTGTTIRGTKETTPNGENFYLMDEAGAGSTVIDGTTGVTNRWVMAGASFPSPSGGLVSKHQQQS